MVINYSNLRKNIIKSVIVFLLIVAIGVLGAYMVFANMPKEVEDQSYIPETPEVVAYVEKDNKARLRVYSMESREGVKFAYYMSTSKDGEYKLLKKTDKAKIVTDKLKPDKKYYFKVKVLVPGEETQLVSAKSDVGQVRTFKEKKPIDRQFELEQNVPTPHPEVAFWGPEVRRMLKLHGAYSAEREAIILNIIFHESRGRESAVNPSGKYVGLIQFGGHWKHDFGEAYFAQHQISGVYKADNRLSGSWSIHRLVESVASGGDAMLRQHWPNTWNK